MSNVAKNFDTLATRLNS